MVHGIISFFGHIVNFIITHSPLILIIIAIEFGWKYITGKPGPFTTCISYAVNKLKNKKNKESTNKK